MNIEEEVKMLREQVSEAIDWLICIKGTTCGSDCNECAEEALDDLSDIREKYDAE